MPSRKYAAYKPAAPYFNLVRGALGDLVDGEHFFDVVTEDTIYEVLYDVPGWPRIIRGRADLMAQFRGYVRNIAASICRQSDYSQHRRRPGRRHRIRGPWNDPRDRREVQQSVLLDHQDEEPEDRALERLHGLPRGVERTNGACPIKACIPNNQERLS